MLSRTCAPAQMRSCVSYACFLLPFWLHCGGLCVSQFCARVQRPATDSHDHFMAQVKTAFIHSPYFINFLSRSSPLTCGPVFTQKFSLARPPTLLVTHGGIFDVSSLLSAAPCRTGVAYPRVLRHRASVDPLRPAAAEPTWLGVHQHSQALTTAQVSGTAPQTNCYRSTRGLGTLQIGP